MLILELDSDTDIICTSQYDSGTHLGFRINTHKKYSHFSQPLNDVLTKVQIQSLEILLVTTTKCFIETKKD